MLVNIIYAGQTMYMLYYVLLLEVKWLLAGHLFPVQLPRFTSFHAQGVSLFCVRTFPSSSFWFEWTNFYNKSISFDRRFWIILGSLLLNVWARWAFLHFCEKPRQNKKWNIFKTQRRLSGPAELEIAAFEKQNPWERKKKSPLATCLFVLWKEKEESEVVWRALKSVIAKARKLSREKVIVATGYHQSFTKTFGN